MTQGFRSQFTRVKGISDIRRLPIRDKIRLGVRVISSRTGKEHAKETDYFVCSPEVQKFYGERPKELEVRFPINDSEIIFPQSYIWWGQSRGAKCRGDGERALRLNEETREMEEKDCPCEKLNEKKCKLRGQLRFFLEKVSLGELFAINLGSFHSIVDINSSLEFIQALVGKFSMIPLKLKRVPKETHGSGRKETHWTLKIVLESNDIEYLNNIRESTKYLPEPRFLLPAPVFENPAMDDGAVVEVEEEDEDQPIEEKQSPPEDQGITEEQALEDLKELGMVPEEKGSEEENKKLEEAKLLNEYSKIIVAMNNRKEVMDWYGANKKAFKNNYSERFFAEITRIVNEKMEKIKK